MRFGPLAAFFVGVLFSSSGRAVDPPEAPLTSGIVYVVGGVGGFDHVGPAAVEVLPLVVPHEVHDFVWTHGWMQWLKDLQDSEHLTHKAADLAAKVLLYRKIHPDRPIYLVGKSGGAGLVLRTAEMLPPETLDRIILLSAAVSPEHDLGPALRATKREIVSFYSPYDWFILGWGTWQFGTADRVYSSSAGKRGFRRPPEGAAEAEPYRRLVEISWSPAMIQEGYFGGHIGTSNASFLAREVAPWLKH